MNGFWRDRLNNTCSYLHCVFYIYGSKVGAHYWHNNGHINQLIDQRAFGTTEQLTYQPKEVLEQLTYRPVGRESFWLTYQPTYVISQTNDHL